MSFEFEWIISNIIDDDPQYLNSALTQNKSHDITRIIADAILIPTNLCITRPGRINSLTPGRCGSNFTSVFLKVILEIVIFSTSCEIVLRWVPENPIEDKITLVQVMAFTWCHQCWSKSMSRHLATMSLIIVAWWCHMATRILSKIGSDENLATFWLIIN